jgi:hypothetical protein
LAAGRARVVWVAVWRSTARMCARHPRAQPALAAHLDELAQLRLASALGRSVGGRGVGGVGVEDDVEALRARRGKGVSAAWEGKRGGGSMQERAAHARETLG